MNEGLDKLTELAKEATRSKLTELKQLGHLIPEEVRGKLALEIGFDGDDLVFELVMADEDPEKAKVFTSVRGNIETMELGDVVVCFDLIACHVRTGEPNI